jgi:hypothetical protein
MQTLKDGMMMIKNEMAGSGKVATARLLALTTIPMHFKALSMRSTKLCGKGTPQTTDNFTPREN